MNFNPFKNNLLQCSKGKGCSKIQGNIQVIVRQESSFKHQLMIHKMCYATEKMEEGPPDSYYRM